MPLADADTYITSPSRRRTLFSRIFLSHPLTFYPQVFSIVYRNSRQAKKGCYGDLQWADSSCEVLRALENVGARIEVEGMHNISAADGPVVFIGNHMSTLETMILPCIIQPVKTATFVVKESLVSMPVFGPIMRSRDPILVGRVNPREDLKAVLGRGAEKLGSGISIIIFPQSTRSAVFNPEEFNSLGVKLAARAGVPVIPLALKTDAWGIGRRVKEFGPLDISKTVHFRFGEPMRITERGAGEHEKIIGFIQESLRKWAAPGG